MSRASFPAACRLAAGLFVGLAAGAAQADDVGIVRISDLRPRQVVRGQSPEQSDATVVSDGIVRTQCAAEPGYCPPGGCNTGAGCRGTHGYFKGGGCPDHSGVYDPNCHRCRLIGGDPVGDVYCPDGQWVLGPNGHWDWFPNHTAPGFWEGLFDNCGEFFKNRRDAFKIGFLNHPETPLVGCYDLVYPVDPYYFDKRDGQVYAAQGVGGPVSVPLAPVVRHTYNYGWGVPSSRLTPISHPVPLVTPKK